jgi:hypothetical protein
MELCAHPMAEGAYRATRVRVAGLILISALTVALSDFAPGMANFAYLLMFTLRPLSQRVARRYPATVAAAG